MASDEQTITIELTPADIRGIVEKHVGEPCFRMIITGPEYAVLSLQNPPDWTFHHLQDGRVAMWRKYSDLAKLKRGRLANPALYEDIKARMIEDHVR